MNPRSSQGRDGFVARYGLDTDAYRDAAAAMAAQIREHAIDNLRLSFVDQHGVLRGKSIPAADIDQVLAGGLGMTSTLLLKDTSHRTVFPVWEAGPVLGSAHLNGAGDVLMVPDPATFRILPWLPATGWLLCDLYFTDGAPVPLSTRRICREALDALSAQGYTYRAGLELEFHVFRLLDPSLKPEHATQPGRPPQVELLAQGYQYLTESRADELEPVVDLLRRTAIDLGLPVRSTEVEFGPSQMEFTFHPADGMVHADNLVLFRSAVRQVCRRHGYHATFMCRPALPNVFSSGWHLHQSLVGIDSGRNALVPGAGELLSAVGRRFVAGLLRNAAACCALTTPTVNGYRRYRPHTLAPDRLHWGADNKAAMIRVIGGAGDPGTRIENRAPEPAANPYLCFAAQAVCAVDGIRRGEEPPPPSDAPYRDDAPRLPASLEESVAALRRSTTLKDALGEVFVDYFATIKEAEVARFREAVTSWEQYEYFAAF